MRRIRIKRNMTLFELGEKINKTEATVQRYESGHIKNLKSDTIEDIANALDVSPAFLMGWVEESPRLPSSEYDFYPKFGQDRSTKVIVPNIFLGKYAGMSNLFMTPAPTDSMNRSIPKGSVICIQTVHINELENDDIVLIHADKFYTRFYDGPFIARYFEEDGFSIFRPDSYKPTFADILIPNYNLSDIEIYGRIVAYSIFL